VTTPRGSVAGEERLQWLTDRLDADGVVTIAEAARALGVHDMTIRRDLIELEARGSVRRVRGGARAVGPTSFAERRDRAGRAKARIAAKLRELVPASGVVAFDASSTIMRLAGSLDGVRDLTVLTNGPETFAALQGLPGVTPQLTGGRLEPRTGSLVGPLACRAATQFSGHTFFLSAAAVDPAAGALELTLDEAEVKADLAAGAGEVILAADASKLDERAFTVSVNWERIDLLVTELDPADGRLARYRERAHVL
jgi:DeoR family fructose operon transcriptional repressor